MGFRKQCVLSQTALPAGLSHYLRSVNLCRLDVCSKRSPDGWSILAQNSKLDSGDDYSDHFHADDSAVFNQICGGTCDDS